MKNLIKVISLLAKYPGSTILGLVAIVISDIVQLAQPWITKFVVDRLEAQTIDRKELYLWGLAMVALAAAAYLAKQIWRHFILGAAKKIENELRQKLLDKTLSLNLRESHKLESGKFMALASSDIPAIGQALAFGVISFFDSLFITIVAFSLMYQLSPTLTAYTLVPFPILVALMMLSLKLIYRRYDKVQQSLEDLTEKTRESVSGIRTLRAYVQRYGDLESFQEKNLDYNNRVLDYAKIDAVFGPLILLFAGSSSGILLYFGGNLVIAGEIGVGTLAAFVGYLGLLTWPMIAAGWMLVLLQRGSASIARLEEIFAAESEVENLPDLVQSGPLNVRGLSFQYPDGTVALKDWNLDLAEGKTLGIVGPVGSGKSTFFKLLLQLEEPPSGALFLGEADLSRHSPGSVRAMFSQVSQEPFLFSDTISNNLRLAKPGSDDTELSRMVEMAALQDDLAQFPLGLETELGERGVSLSGGQKQRAALARALLKSAPFLLLDDTLSAVDTVTETKILSQLRREQTERKQALIVISHRLSAVAHADEIIVVDKGEIVDRGTHRELSSRPGLYLELLQHQKEENHDQLV